MDTVRLSKVELEAFAAWERKHEEHTTFIQIKHTPSRTVHAFCATCARTSKNKRQYTKNITDNDEE